MNRANKTMPWVAASLLAVTSLFGQNQNQNNSCPAKSCPSGPPVCQPVKPTCQPQVCRPAKPAVCGVLQEPQMPLNAAYNAPAEINIGMQCDWDMFVTANFLYWQPLADNMDVGLVNDNLLVDLDVNGFGLKGHYVDMDFDYKPGFKAGLGCNLGHDDWVVFAEYTRLHGRHTVSASTDSAAPNIFATRGHPWILSNQGQVFSSVIANYRCNLDFVDAQMERVYYVGQYLIFHSSYGLRGAWILQNMHTRYDATVAVTNLPAFSTNGTTDVYGRIHSWAVGPRAGLKMDWVFGDGFRFYGNSFVDVLYTKYKVQDKTVVIARDSAGDDLEPGQVLSFITRDKVNAVRTHLDMELGLGWGTYFSCNDWHVDFSIGYGFQAFFNQNMFQRYQDDIVLGMHSEENGNLYVQGLNVAGRLDF